MSSLTQSGSGVKTKNLSEHGADSLCASHCGLKTAPSMAQADTRAHTFSIEAEIPKGPQCQSCSGVWEQWDVMNQF